MASWGEVNNGQRVGVSPPQANVNVNQKFLASPKTA